MLTLGVGATGGLSLFRRVRNFLVLLVILLPLGFFLKRPLSKAALPKPYGRPRLILMLEIDQFRYDYLVRFRPQFVERGFNLLLGGANFVNCRYDYATTLTGPGHATLFTGAYPNLHGIIDNEWFDRSLGRTVNCVEDTSTRLLGAEGRGASPKNLIGSTISDELRFASDFQSKVVSIALKDRGAILPGGHAANAAYWYDVNTGHFISSTYYMQGLPPWVNEFNSRSPAKAFCRKPWQALPETPGAGGRIFEEFKPEGNEVCPNPRFLEWLEHTPTVTTIQLDFVREAIKNERLGQGPGTDLIAVSISANDYIGHTYGPYSPEVADATLRTDRYLADLFNDLDRMVGLDKVWIAFSADHGVAPTYPFIQEHHLATVNVRPSDINAAIERALSQAFGPDRWVEEGGGHLNFYLNQEALNRHRIGASKAEAVAAAAAASVPGVTAVYTRGQLLRGNLPESPLTRKVLHSFNPLRSGDIFVVLAPYAIPTRGEKTTTHGSPWNYDAQVPLILWGSAFRPGTYSSPCQPIDLAPTLAAAMELTQPSSAQGRPLSEALR